MFLTLLAAVAALFTGLTVLFLFFGLGRLSPSYQRQQQQMDFLQDITRSEIEVEREETGVSNPRSWTGYWANLAISAGFKFETERNPGLIVAGGMLALFLFGALAIPRDVLGGVLFAAGGLVIANIVLRAYTRRRISRLEKQLPILLSGLRASLQAQKTPQQALVEQADSIPSPLGDDLKLLRDDINVNIALDMALANFQNRVPSREVRFLVSSIRIAIASGSDLDPLIATIQDIVVQRTRIANMLAAAVAQVQPALWVTGVLIPLGFLFSYYSDDRNKQFWGSLLGLILLAGVAFLYVVGLIVARAQVNRVRKA